MKRPRRKRGSAMLEFVLAGVPMVFAWVSIIQMAIGMQFQHTPLASCYQQWCGLGIHG